ncbi:uncharacterized protein [Amphiura filiformis]|uniref:uncharacterized protein n=1 Tax=Amphiura filiformis TaxID=82378 RepID=UPI003B2284C8
MAANEEDIDIENLDETNSEGVSSTEVMFEDSRPISDPGGLSNQWGLYDDQQLFGGEVWPSYDDNAMDPESRATIERMLQEEKRYLQRTGSAGASKGKTKKATTSSKRSDKAHIVKGIWTEEEVAGFHEGMELFGRQWSKVAEHIGTRTTLQVKNYGRNHLKKMASLDSKLDDLGNQSEQSPDKLSTDQVHSHIPENFETGSTTCSTPPRTATAAPRGRPRKKTPPHQAKNVAKIKPSSKSPSPKKMTKRDVSESPQKEETKMQEDTIELDPTKVNIIEEKSGESQVMIKEGEAVHIQDASGSEEDVDVDVEEEDEEDETGATTMVAMDVVEKEEAVIKDEDVESKLEEERTTCEELAKSEDTITSLHTEGMTEVEIVANEDQEMAVSVQSNVMQEVCDVKIDKKESVQLLEQPKQLLEEQVSDDDDKKDNDETNVQYKLIDSGNVTSEIISTIGDSKAVNISSSEMDLTVSDADSAGSEIDDTSNDLEEITPKATEELILEKDTISETEKLLNADYFEAGYSRTPQRYLTIRNKIVECWNKCKPSYLTKTAVRPNLRGCGDVNRISAIHSALEHLGAINFGIDNPFHVVISARYKTRINRVQSSPHAVTLRPRRKRMCNSEEAKAERMKTEETKPITRVSTRPSKKRRVAYDPFKLIQCAEFNEDNLAPYHVVMNSSALAIMDLHAHLATTEVIGLLGGDYNETTRVLEISEAKPCKSLSTGMQCEMDPVSQTEASESIMAAGGRVVGWYHSHPTFAPNPSVRDIETQSDFQAWFGPHVPYVGVIVSPYLRGLHSRCVQSVFKCLTISHELVDDSNTRKPYSFSFTAKQDLTSNKDSLLEITKDIITQYASYPYRTEMLKWNVPRSPDKPYMEKVLTSIKSHLSPTPDSDSSQSSTCNEILDAIRSHITSSFAEKSSDGSSTSGGESACTGDVVDHDEGIRRQDEIQKIPTGLDGIT